MSTQLDSQALNQLFLAARTANGFLDQPVAPELLKQVYELARMAPTAMNSQPTRYVFITTPEAKARLLPLMAAGNVD
ncbi:nitroreductase family protein, partial [Leptospira sp. 96542]|nr:nitroreductase family protein [Leptospira sp. 96542]